MRAKSRPGTLSISEVAGQFGLRTSALRYYEQIGLLRPIPRVGGQRCYDQAAIQRLAVISASRRAGLSLSEIAADDLIVVSANQEHGIIGLRSGARFDVEQYPVGTLLRILPNHACATAAQHDRYHLIRAGSCDVVDNWPRISGW